MADQPENLGQLLDKVAEAAAGSEEASLGRIVETVGRRSFGSPRPGGVLAWLRSRLL